MPRIEPEYLLEGAGRVLDLAVLDLLESLAIEQAYAPGIGLDALIARRAGGKQQHQSGKAGRYRALQSRRGWPPASPASMQRSPGDQLHSALSIRPRASGLALLGDHPITGADAFAPFSESFLDFVHAGDGGGGIDLDDLDLPHLLAGGP